MDLHPQECMNGICLGRLACEPLAGAIYPVFGVGKFAGLAKSVDGIKKCRLYFFAVRIKRYVFLIKRCGLEIFAESNVTGGGISEAFAAVLGCRKLICDLKQIIGSGLVISLP